MMMEMKIMIIIINIEIVSSSFNKINLNRDKIRKLKKRGRNKILIKFIFHKNR